MRGIAELEEQGVVGQRPAVEGMGEEIQGCHCQGM